MIYYKPWYLEDLMISIKLIILIQKTGLMEEIMIIWIIQWVMPIKMENQECQICGTEEEANPTFQSKI